MLDLLLPLVGTPAFLPSLLSYIRNTTSTGSLPLDPVIFHAILLCIIAGDKHLLLHTPEEDVGLVVRLAAWVSEYYFSVLCPYGGCPSSSEMLSPPPSLIYIFRRIVSKYSAFLSHPHSHKMSMKLLRNDM